jgi:starch synthase
MSQPLRVLIVSSEVAPLASTGGLGRSVGGLAGALKTLGVDVRVVMPKYQEVKANVTGLTRLVPKMRIRTISRFGETAIYREELPGELPVYLIDKDKYFDREYLYGPPGEVYEDNAERFCFLNICALEMLTQIGFYPEIIHCHDWHTGLIPVYLHTLFRQDPLYIPIRTLYTIHDLVHRGRFSREKFSMTGLPESIYTPEGIEFYGGMSFLKAGIVYAEVLNTESKRYRQEIQTPEHGFGFEGLFQSRSKDLYGVVNGVDYKHYDPRVDAFIAANYTKDELEKKRLCKRDLLNICHLDQDSDMPLIGMIAPFDEQKGIDLLIQVLADMVKFDLQFIFLNSEHFRDHRYVKRLNELAVEYGTRIRCYSNYDQQLEHKILAGADILLVPSRSEPCGLIQMYSLKYGTIPLVRATGGLDDTIVDFTQESNKGNGFKFYDYTPEALLSKLQEALTGYRNRSLWELLQTNAMRVNYSWVYSGKKYLDLYNVAMSKAKFSPMS